MKLDCRYFNGYKPCGKNDSCDNSCQAFSKRGQKILVLHFGALGAVLRSTPLLRVLQRECPGCSITWLTESPAHHLLANNPAIESVLTFSLAALMELSVQIFDLVLIVDKSLAAAGVLKQLQYKEVRGFVSDKRQACTVPANPEAEELWQIGLSNTKKFYNNQKSEIQLICESFGYPFKKEEYYLNLLELETRESKRRRIQWSQGGTHCLIGLNTGCSGVLRYKKPSRKSWLQIIADCQSTLKTQRPVKFVLLGGAEDQEDHDFLKTKIPDLLQSPTAQGLRDGLLSVAACDYLITGDSLGMHMGIALKVPLVTWFGPSVVQEIEFYGRGIAVKSDFACSPCWNRNCDQILKCNEQVDVLKVIGALQTLVHRFEKNQLELSEIQDLSL